MKPYRIERCVARGDHKKTGSEAGFQNLRLAAK
jgi:hypothetical protein